MKRIALALLAFTLCVASASAQVVSNPAIPPNTVCSHLASPPTLSDGQASWLQCDASGSLITTSAGGGPTTVPGFTPGGTFATLTATGSSASVALPAGVTVAFQNTGTTAVSCTLGIGSATATTNEVIVQGSSTVFVVPGTNTFGACIDQTGSASNLVVLAGGAGLGTGFGGSGDGTTTSNITQFGGVNLSTGTGASGTGIPRVTVSSDSSLAANQSVNVAQWGGVSTATGQVAVNTAPVTATNTALVVDLRPDSPGIVTLGQTTKSAGIPVAWASDQVGTAGSAASTVLSVQGVASMTPVQVAGTGAAGTANAGVVTVQGIASMTKLLVTPDSVALPANQSVNVAQVNGVTTSVNTGVAGTGTQRVTLSNTDPCMSPDIAKSSAPINITSGITTSLVAVSGSTVVYVCGFAVTIAPSAVTADTIAFEYGTGAACTSPTLLTGTFGNGDLTTTVPVTPIHYGGAGSTIFKSAASAGICALTAGSAVNIQGVLTYVQQ